MKYITRTYLVNNLFKTLMIKIPFILEPNKHYSSRGLKIRCGLESRADWIRGRELDFGKK